MITLRGVPLRLPFVVSRKAPHFPGRGGHSPLRRPLARTIQSVHVPGGHDEPPRREARLAFGHARSSLDDDLTIASLEWRIAGCDATPQPFRPRRGASGGLTTPRLSYSTIRVIAVGNLVSDAGHMRDTIGREALPKNRPGGLYRFGAREVLTIRDGRGGRPSVDVEGIP